jgi:hypothetical protein
LGGSATPGASAANDDALKIRLDGRDCDGRTWDGGAGGIFDEASHFSRRDLGEERGIAYHERQRDQKAQTSKPRNREPHSTSDVKARPLYVG